MKKVIALFVVLVVVLISVATVMEARDKVVFWGWTRPEADADFAEFLKLLEAKADVDIEYQAISGTWVERKEKISVAIASNTGPDITWVRDEWYDDFARLVQPMDDFIAHFSDRRDLIQAGLAVGEVNGRQLFLPITVEPSVTWYNYTMLSDLGIPQLGDGFDTDQLLIYSQKASRDLDGDGVVDRRGFFTWDFQVPSMIWTFGGEIFKDGNLSVDNTQMRAAMQYYRQFWERNLISSWNELEHVGFRNTPDRAWAAGYVAFALSSGTYRGRIAIDTGNFEPKAALVPKGPSGIRTALFSANGLAIPINSRNKDAAYRILDYYLSREHQISEATLYGAMPIRSSLALSSYYLGNPKYPFDRNLFYNAMSYARPAPKGVNWSIVYLNDGSPIRVAFYNFLSGAIPYEQMIEQLKKTVPPLMPGGK